MEEEHGIDIVPGQLPARYREPPEIELYRAILRSACEDLAHRNPAIRADAYAWFAQPHDGYPISLCYCCRVLDLNPRKVARHALRWAGLA